MKLLRRCTCCKEYKSSNKFTVRRSKGNEPRYYSWCRSCVGNLAKLKPEYKWRVLNKLWDGFLNAYGNKCTCCGEDNKLFLTVEHLNGDGKTHRQRLGGLSIEKMLRDIRDQGYPDKYTVLCFNCNLGKSRNKGICPHVQIHLRHKRQ